MHETYAPPRLEICSCWFVHVAPVLDKCCGSAVPLVAQGRAAAACCTAIDAAPAAGTDPVTNIQFTSYMNESCVSDPVQTDGMYVTPQQ
jgi:predicted nicotinamide N-methyase